MRAATGQAMRIAARLPRKPAKDERYEIWGGTRLAETESASIGYL